MSGSRSLHRRRNFRDRPGTKRRGAFLSDPPAGPLRPRINQKYQKYQKYQISKRPTGRPVGKAGVFASAVRRVSLRQLIFFTKAAAMSGSRSLHRRRNFRDRPGTKRRGAFLSDPPARPLRPRINQKYQKFQRFQKYQNARSVDQSERPGSLHRLFGEFRSDN